MVAERKLTFLSIIFAMLLAWKNGPALSLSDGDEGSAALSTIAELIPWYGFEPNVISATGSAGRLQGFTRFPVSGFFDLASRVRPLSDREMQCYDCFAARSESLR